jgi:hypothetical protein
LICLATPDEVTQATGGDPCHVCGKRTWEHDPKQGNWFPGNGGTETPFLSRSGKRLQYMWQPSTGRHAYLDLSTDFILSDEEAALALGHA